MELIDEGKKVLGQTLEKLQHFIVFLGVGICGFSFTTYNAGFHFPTATPNWIILGLGIVFVIIGIVLHLISVEKKNKKLKNKTTLKFNATTLSIKIANLQDEENLSSECAFILPANTSFADDCVTDSKTALGSFFNKHHPEKIPQFNQKLKATLKARNIIPIEGIHYAPSTAIILPEEYSIKAKVILVASSVRNSGKGFHTDPSIISNSVRNIFKETADQRISTFYFPIIGSGHAGLEITEALNLLILCIKFHAKSFHHPKNIYIFVRENDSKKINANFLNSFN
jgi:hypothetical protein